MKNVARNEILDLGEYEAIRPHFRRRVIELKKRRRVALGGNMTVLFETHDTVLLQIQEMLRTERITREDAIEHEVATYNDLVPNDDELSATIFIEYPDADERERMLTELAGVEDAFYVEINGRRCRVQSEPRGSRTDRTTAVHYVKFPLPKAAVDALRDRSPHFVLGVEHPGYNARAVLDAPAVEELRADLA